MYTQLVSKLVKDLELGDVVYAHKFSPNGITLGIERLGVVVEKNKPNTCMGLIDFGVSQGFRLYDSTLDKVKYYGSFTDVPVLVEKNSSDHDE